MPSVQLLDLIDLREDSRAEAASANVDRILKAIRAHLRMDVAFASNVTATHTIIRNADTGPHAPFGAGDAFPVEDGYCKRILDGRIPPLIHDAAQVSEVAGLACTKEMPIGAHLSVPIRLSDGTVYGTFCCFSFQPDPSLSERDVEIMRAFAELAAQQIEAEMKLATRRAEATGFIEQLIDQNLLTMVYQPIYDLAADEVVGVEALARFPDHGRRSADQWFAEAADAGLGVELELAAVRAALRGLPHLPNDIYLSVNLSPEALLCGRAQALLEEVPAGRIVIEVTEHAVVSDVVPLLRALEPLRGRTRIAIDDVGAGYSGLRRILELRPDIIKLDMSLTRNIDADPARAALTSALITFARDIGSKIVAEGIETAAELASLRRLGADCGQGYHLQRPKPIAALSQFLIARRFGRAADGDKERPVPRRPLGKAAAAR